MRHGSKFISRKKIQWSFDLLNEPLFNENLDITNVVLYPSNSKIYERIASGRKHFITVVNWYQG